MNRTRACRRRCRRLRRSVGCPSCPMRQGRRWIRTPGPLRPSASTHDAPRGPYAGPVAPAFPSHLSPSRQRTTTPPVSAASDSRASRSPRAVLALSRHASPSSCTLFIAEALDVHADRHCLRVASQFSCPRCHSYPSSLSHASVAIGPSFILLILHASLRYPVSLYNMNSTMILADTHIEPLLVLACIVNVITTIAM